MNKLYLIIFIYLLFISPAALAQTFESPQIAFNQAANDYVFDGENKAISTLNKALKEYPNDQKLRALLEKILKDRQQKQQQNQQEKKEQQSENQKQQNQENQKQKDQQDQQKQNQQQQEQQEKKDQQQQQQDQKASEKENAEEKKGNPQSQQQEQAEKSDKEKGEKEMPQIDPSQMEELNISPEKARMILEAMKNNEIQYLQQMQRRPTQRPDSNEPDW